MYVHSNYAFFIFIFYLVATVISAVVFASADCFFKLMNDWNNELCWKSQHEKKCCGLCELGMAKELIKTWERDRQTDRQNDEIVD